MVIKKLTVNDDRDWGEGELRFPVRVGPTETKEDNNRSSVMVQCKDEDG